MGADPAAVADPATELTPPPPDGAAPDAPAKPGNAWEAARANVRTLSADADEDETAGADDGEEHPTTDAPPAKPPTPDDKAAPKPAATDAPKKGVELLGPAGAKITWPEGVKVRLQADGRPVEVATFDELCTLAQKGPFFERRANELTRDNQKLSGQLSVAKQGTEVAVQQVREEAEEILLTLAADPAAYDKFRTAAQKYLDPDVRAGLKATADLKRREAADTERAAADKAAQAETFWKEQTTRVETVLADEAATYEFLEPEDGPEILQSLYTIYTMTAEQMLEQAAPGRSRFAGTDDEWAAVIHQQAQAAAFAPETLTDLLAKLNDRYASRVRTKREAAKADDAVRAAGAHNDRTEKRLDQQDRASVRSSGTPPGTGKPPAPRPATYEGHQREIKSLFDEMRAG